jgi:hypothetical protein
MKRIVEIQEKCKQQKKLSKNWNHKFQRKKVTPNEYKFKINSSDNDFIEIGLGGMGHSRRLY